MPADKKIRVAIVGLGFGAEFIPIYQNHPNAEIYAICRRDTERARRDAATASASRSAIPTTTRCSPTPTSTPSTSTRRSPTTRRSRSRRSRRASTSPARCRWPRRSTNAGRSSSCSDEAGKIYMMMETVVYSREYLFVKELYDKGELGRVQFLRGSHQQDMEGWPGYWEGLPPMHYATHCVSPCLALLGKARRARRLPRLGADRRGADPEVRQSIRDRDGDVQARATRTSCAEVTRSLFDTARQYRESFDAYGSKKSFEWQQVENEEPVIHTEHACPPAHGSRRSRSA